LKFPASPSATLKNSLLQVNSAVDILEHIMSAGRARSRLEDQIDVYGR
jgi:hypothetical protein